MHREECKNMPLIKDDPIKGFLYSLGGVLFVSTNFVTAKFCLQGFNPETFSFVWASAAAMYALGFIGFGRMSKKQIFPTKNLKAMLLLGTATGVSMILGLKGLALLDPTFAAFLYRFSPILTISCGMLVLKERLERKEIFAMMIMLLGGLLSVVGRWEIIGAGVTFTILAICAGVIQLLIAKSKVHQVHPNVMVAYRVGIAAMVIAIWIFATDSANFSVEIRYWYIALLGAFLGPCVSFLFTFRSYQYWSLSQSSIVLTAQPLLVLPMAYGFLGTFPTERELFGGCMILVGAFWLAYIYMTKTSEKKLEI